MGGRFYDDTAAVVVTVHAAMHAIIRERFVAEKGTTILLCTHDLTEAQELAQHLIFLHEGTVRAEGTLARLRAQLEPHVRVRLEFARPPAPAWHEVLQATVRSESDEAVEIEARDTGAIPAIVEAAVTAGGRITSCRREEESLSELFSRLTGGAPS